MLIFDVLHVWKLAVFWSFVAFQCFHHFMSLKTIAKHSKVQFMAIQRPIVVPKLLMMTKNYEILKKTVRARHQLIS